MLRAMSVEELRGTDEIFNRFLYAVRRTGFDGSQFETYILTFLKDADLCTAVRE